MISDDFDIDEFTRSRMARKLGYNITLGQWEHEQIARLVKTCLQPIRSDLGVPLVITSGFRPPWLNLMVRGAQSSMHLYGCAADFKTPGTTLEGAFYRIIELDLPIDQLILEDPPWGWIHLGVAMPGQDPRKQYMIAKNTTGTVEYSVVN